MKYDYCEDDMILKVYPTMSACFEAAFSLMKKHFWMLVLVVFVGAAIDSPLWFMRESKPTSDGFQISFQVLDFLQMIYYFAVASVYSYGVAYVFLKAVRKEKFEFEDALLGFKNYSRAVFSNILVVFIVGLGIILLVIPGIFMACRLIFVPYLIMTKKHGIVDSLKVSYYMTKGYFWTIFGMCILSFILILLGLVFLGIGIIVSLVWINAAFAVLYNAAVELHYNEACKMAGLPVPEDDVSENETLDKE